MRHPCYSKHDSNKIANMGVPSNNNSKNNFVMMKNLIILLIFSCLNIVGHGQTPTFLATFENQTTNPEIAQKKPLIELNHAALRVSANPHPDKINSSDYVLRFSASPGTKVRAEYSVGRLPTLGKKYIYTWSRFHPENMFVDVSFGLTWCYTNQWKTWPCEAPPISNPAYQYFDTLICDGGGIFNDMGVDKNNTLKYRSRAIPNCNTDYFNLPRGQWNRFILEVYWTPTENGYYRIWRNDTLFGYSDKIKTLPEGFIEGTCDMYWSNGIYTGWSKIGDQTTDSLIAYVDDIGIYDLDNGYAIKDVCPDCEAAPAVATDSIVYKININGAASMDGYNNFIISYRGDTVAKNLSSTFGQSRGIDIYMPGDATVGSTRLTGGCFPEAVIKSRIAWSDTITRKIYLKDLSPSKKYNFKLLSASATTTSNSGVQIWTKDENRDTVYAAGNTCNMAVLTNLVSDASGDLTINVGAIGGAAYINSIEIVEFKLNNGSFVKKTDSDGLKIFPNPARDNLFITGETVASEISVYSCDGRKVKCAENTNNIDISDLKKGIYIILVTINEAFVTSRIIKE